MEKNIKDYLHLYLGCEVLIVDKVITGTGDNGIVENKHTGHLTTTSILGTQQRFRVVIGGMSTERVFNIDNDKLLFRPLSDITEDEAWQCNGASGDTIAESGKQVVDYYRRLQMYEPEETRYLLSKHFDLFGLIDAGLAIDKTTINEL